MTLFLEVSSILLFGYYLYHAIRDSNWELLFLAFFYALIFENLSIVVFAGQEGSYFYNEGFNIFLYKTPLYIVLFWACIIYSAYGIVKRIVSSPRQFYFLAPLYILLLDIVLDVVAVDLGLWTWVGFENGRGFYGVPASNYLGWLLISFSFFLVYDKIYLLNKKRFDNLFLKIAWFSLQILLSFSLFFSIILPLHFLKCYLDLGCVGQYLLASFVFIIFLILAIGKLKKCDKAESRPELYLFNIRIFLHVFSLFGLFFSGLYKDITLVLIFLLILGFELYVLQPVFCRYFKKA